LWITLCLFELLREMVTWVRAGKSFTFEIGYWYGQFPSC